MMDMIFSWSTVWWALLVLYVPCCFGLIIIVLLQKGKGVGFAGAFGAGGGSEAVFGPRSSKSLPQRITYSMAGLFMLIALLMSMLSGNLGSSSAPDLVDDTGMSAIQTSAPAGSLEALFGDGSVEDTSTPAVEESVVPAVTVETTDVPADATISVDTTPPAEAITETAAPEAAPAETTAPAEAAAPSEAPAAQ